MTKKGSSSRGYQLTNIKIASLLDIKGKPITKALKVSKLRKEGLPDTADPGIIFTYDLDRNVKKLEKTLNTKSSKARQLGINYQSYRNYEKLGMPDEVESAFDWIKERKKKVSRAEIGRALDLSRERIRQLIVLGMPFNQSDNPIQDSIDWYYEWQKKNAEIISKGFRLNGKITQRKLCKELTLTPNKLKSFIEEGMPTANVDEALQWLQDNKIKVGKHWKDNDESGFRLWFRHQFNVSQSMYNKCIKFGLPRGIEEPTAWMNENAFKHTGMWKLANPKNIKKMMCVNLQIPPYQYDRFIESGMAKANVKEAARWIHEQFLRTEFGLIAR